MTASQSIAKRGSFGGMPANLTTGDVLEKVITTSDLADLSPLDKVKHIKNVCESLGLNPLTRPIQLIKFQGKEVMYVTKDATEQLRKNHNVSISKVENKIIDGSIYVVTVYATTPEGRTDASTGAIPIAGLKGDALCNAMLKAETKAKRRVTLSICGLGFIDESEVESMPGAKKIDVEEKAVFRTSEAELEVSPREIDNDVAELLKSETIEKLQDQYKEFYKYWSLQKDKESLRKIIDAKDKRKEEITIQDFNKEIDGETGEVLT